MPLLLFILLCLEQYIPSTTVDHTLPTPYEPLPASPPATPDEQDPAFQQQP